MVPEFDRRDLGFDCGQLPIPSDAKAFWMYSGTTFKSETMLTADPDHFSSAYILSTTYYEVASSNLIRSKIKVVFLHSFIYLSLFLLLFLVDHKCFFGWPFKSGGKNCGPQFVSLTRKYKGAGSRR